MGQSFPFEYLSTVRGCKRLMKPNVSSSFLWGGKEVGSISSTTCLYIMAVNILYYGTQIHLWAAFNVLEAKYMSVALSTYILIHLAICFFVFVFNANLGLSTTKYLSVATDLMDYHTEHTLFPRRNLRNSPIVTLKVQSAREGEVGLINENIFPRQHGD